LGQTAVTDNQGYYEFKNMIAGRHTITPTHPFHTFIPEYRNVILPPDVSSQNFTIIARPVSKIISPGNSSTLVYSDTQGLPTTLTLAPDSLSVTTTLYLTPTHLMAPTGYAFSGHALRISPNITFPSPVTLTINYSQNDIRLFHDLNELKILWQMNSDWQDAILSCSATRSITPQITAIADGMLSGTICQTGLFTFFGPTHQLFFPITE
jgi:hypothetical protein